MNALKGNHVWALNDCIRILSDFIILLDCEDIEGFTWEEYLELTNTIPVPASAFLDVSRKYVKMLPSTKTFKQKNWDLLSLSVITFHFEIVATDYKFFFKIRISIFLSISILIVYSILTNIILPVVIVTHRLLVDKIVTLANIQ